jgi:hypothetical protein
VFRCRLFAWTWDQKPVSFTGATRKNEFVDRPRAPAQPDRLIQRRRDRLADFFFLPPVFRHQGRIAHAAHLPHLPSQARRQVANPSPRHRSPTSRAATSVSRAPPVWSTSRRPYSSRYSSPLCRILRSSPAQPRSTLDAARAGTRMPSQVPRSGCVVSEGTFPAIFPPRKDRFGYACLGFGLLGVQANLRSVSPYPQTPQGS